jgi:phenylpyruvate tautomerase PptA (4-oxalocrotonate tautomerase family)
MPSVLIEIRRAIRADEEVAMIEAVHSALREAFKIPPGDRNIRLVVHEPHRFACPPQLTLPELFTLINVDAFTGRSLDAKRAFYVEVVEKLEQIGIPKDHVIIVLREISTENWGIRGGQAACDVELGFKIDV